ncbi:unnamed protein product [Ceutorhynchus assimilis]|uniref:Uncharacterized protein n=1 Tax=Ceutorhynchus assimilis TaxID=467358 RepID=A0A9P0GQU8_9CUCU|nr:unnamed protein product [Ceutorhynchus assimilis]
MMVQERLWIDHHSPHHHPHPRTDLVYPMSPENGFGKDPPSDSPASSDSEDLHYGPGIVNRLRNKYLSLALRESNNRPTILRKATSLENLLDDDGGEETEKEDIRLFARRNGGQDGANRYRSSSRRQDMKRARSVEVISRTNHEEELTMTSSVTAKINNRQSLHEDMLTNINENKGVLIENTKSYKKPVSIENGTEDSSEKYSRKINRPKRISPLLNEREKPPVDVVKHAKLIFEKRPETRTKKPVQTGEVSAKINSFNCMIVKTKLAATKPSAWKRTPKPVPNGEVAAKVDSFNDIIVKTKVALKSTKPAIKTQKPVLHDKPKSNTHHHAKPVAKPVIISEELVKPKTLELKSSKQKGFNSLPSPIPDVRVDIKHQDGTNPRNNLLNYLSETPDLILTSSPLPKITSPTYRKKSTQTFIEEERNRSLEHPEATNKFISPVHSPTKIFNQKQSSLNFNREDELDCLGMKMISPISQKNITKNSASSVFNFLNASIDQKHLPLTKKNGVEQKSLIESELNGFGNSNKIKVILSPIEAEKNLRNSVKFSEEPVIVVTEVDVQKLSPDVATKNLNANKSWQNLGNIVEKQSSIFENLSKNEHFTKTKTVSSDSEPTRQDLISVEPSEEVILESDKLDKIEIIIDPKKSASDSNKSSIVDPVSEDKSKVVLPKKTKSRQEESAVAVFNFTSRKDVPDYISNDTSRAPMRPVIPKPDEPGIKLLPEALLTNFKEIQEVWEEDELIKTLEARPPSPCDVTFINDNVLIEGKSSLTQSTSKRMKLKISFIDDAEIYEYPSESSMLLEDSQERSIPGTSQVGQTIPTLSGSSLSSYTPKTTEDFQLGITKSFQEPPPLSPKPVETQEDQQTVLEEVEQPVLFSSGSTSDILF